MCEKFTSEKIVECWNVLEAGGFMVRYEVDGEPIVASRNHFRYNTFQNWDRVGSPEFPHPPGFEIPESLAEYLSLVEQGRYTRKCKTSKERVTLTIGEAMTRLSLTEAHFSTETLPADSPRVVTVREGEAMTRLSLTEAHFSTETLPADSPRVVTVREQGDPPSEGEGVGIDTGEGECEGEVRTRSTSHVATDHMLGPQIGVWRLFMDENFPGIPPTGAGPCNRRDWALHLARNDHDPNYPLHGRELEAALIAAAPSVSTLPWDLLNVLEKKEKAQSGQRDRTEEKQTPEQRRRAEWDATHGQENRDWEELVASGND
jgi:hypothetical protein